MNTEYCYNHKKDTRAGTCHYDIIDPMARFVVGWSEYGPFLLSPFTLHPSLYIPDFATPSVQPFRVAFLTDYQCETFSNVLFDFLFSQPQKCSDTYMILYEIKIKFNINFKIKFHDFKPLLIQPFSISIFLIIQFLNNFEVLKLKHKSDSLKNIFKIN